VGGELSTSLTGIYLLHNSRKLQQQYKKYTNSLGLSVTEEIKKMARKSSFLSVLFYSAETNELQEAGFFSRS